MPQTFVQRTAAQELGRQLGQSRPADTAAASLYSPPDGVVTKVEKIIVVGTAGALVSIFHDEDGTTYDQTTALMYDRTVAANETIIFEIDAYMNDQNGNIAVKTSVNDALTFTAYGTEIRTRAR